MPKPAKPNPRNQLHRTRASRIRAKLDKGGAVSEEEARFIREYDANRSERPSPSAAPPALLTEAIESGADVGASEEGRSIKFELKENKKAIGTGDAAAVAAGAFNLQTLAAAMKQATEAMAKAHSESTSTLKTAADVYKSIALDLRELTRDLLQSEINAREQYREHYLARIDVEGRLRALLKERVEKAATEEQKDPMDALVEEAARRLFGSVLDGVLPGKPNGAGPAVGHKPGANGTGKGTTTR